LGKNNPFMGHQILVPKEGAFAIHINAVPVSSSRVVGQCWEKVCGELAGGVPAIVEAGNYHKLF
jgi:hypothetical protein